MLLARGELLPDSERGGVLDRLESEINGARMAQALGPERVIGAVDALGKRLAAGEFDALLAQYLPAGVTVEGDLLPLLRRETLEERVRVELGEDPWTPRTLGRTQARLAPLGTLFHITAGNMPGLPVFSAVEGLLTGNVNLVKLPRSDGGLSLAALKLLVDQEPLLAQYVYAFDIPSENEADLQRLANLADGMVTWGGDGAVLAARSMAPAGCKLMEWGHRLGFAYISGSETPEPLLAQLAEHIVSTSQRLCSSCQVIYLDTDDFEEICAFSAGFLKVLEGAAARLRPQTPGSGALSTLHGHTAFLERVVEGRWEGERHFPGRGCSVTARRDGELELSPMEGNVFVKPLPRKDLLPTLRRKKGYLQTAGLICPEGEREELTGLLIRAGVTRVTRAGGMSDAFPGEGHDGEYPLRRYVRVVDVEM